MSERLYKVKGSFEILFSLEDGANTRTETHMAVEDLIKIALEDGHMRVKNVRVEAIIPDKLIVVEKKEEKSHLEDQRYVDDFQRRRW